MSEPALKLRMTVVSIENVGEGVTKTNVKRGMTEVTLQGSTPQDSRQFVLAFSRSDPRVHDYRIGQRVDINLTPQPFFALT